MPKVLLIDDEMSVLIVLRALFKSAGFDPVMVQGGQPALELIKAGEFDLIVSDIRMHPINGIDMLKFARTEHPHVPVILISAFGNDETNAEMQRLGAYGYLKKPFSNQEVVRLALEALSNVKKPDA